MSQNIMFTNELNCYLKSKVEAKDGKFIEIHKDKADLTLDALITKEVVGDELIVVSIVS